MLDADNQSAMALAQTAIGIAVLAVLALAPPVSGRMLVMPLSADAAATLARDAVARGARLVSLGPVPGSLIIEGRRADVAGPTGRYLVLASPYGGCSA